MFATIRSLVFGLASIILSSALGQEPDLSARVYAKAAKSVFLIVIKATSGEAVGQASGFCVEGNKIVTNEHVIRGGTAYVDLGGLRVPLRIVSVDSLNDLAVLTPDGEISAPPLRLASADPRPGTSILAIGNPEGLERSVSTGVIAGARSISGRSLLQISAPISHGSSGGPVLSLGGEVVGVTVGMLESGQNLNFAVPASVLRSLLNGQPVASDLESLLARTDALSEKKWKEEVSDAADSPFKRIESEIDTIFNQALDVAGKDVRKLALVGEKAVEHGSSVSVLAFERIVEIKPAPEAYVKLARALKAQGGFGGFDGSNHPTLKKAETAIRSAFKISRQPTMEMYAVLADVVEDRELTEESRIAFGKYYDMARVTGDKDEIASAIRGLIRTNGVLNRPTDVDRWFKALVDSGAAGPWDWQRQAERQFARKDYRSAGDSYVRAAQAQYLWNNWCHAASAYSATTGAADDALQAARACIKNAAGKKDSDTFLANAHFVIASALNQRGVYEEALNHAREAVAIEARDPFSQEALAESFSGLRRFQEAITAFKEAIRLSDGKYNFMHFGLGSAYFETENWQAARQSFEKAAELDPKDDAAAYNVALCMARLGYFRDAANWFEEVLRRNPGRKDRQDILSKIQALRR